MKKQSSPAYMIFEGSDGSVRLIQNTGTIAEAEEFFRRQSGRAVYHISESIDQWGTIHLWDVEQPESWCKIYCPSNPHAPKVTA